jgi:fibronectin type 3 domain-containing protein
MRYRKFTILILLIATIAFAGTVFVEYSATPLDNKVNINWKTGSETGVDQFQIKRSSDDNLYVEIGVVNKQGDGSEYEYIDDNVIFKGGQTFFYKIRAIKSNGSLVEESQSLIVNPNISGIYRTWGAIKAMFR